MRNRTLLLILLLLAAVAGCQLFGQTGVFGLRINSIPEGIGEVRPGSKEFEEGSEVTLEAELGEIEKENYRFIHWEGDITSTDNPHKLTIRGNTDVTAIFGLHEYSLTIQVDGQGTVSNSIVGSAIREDEGGPALYDSEKDFRRGTKIQLEATPEEGWKFCHWRGENFTYCRGENPTIDGKHVRMWGDQTVTGVFSPELQPCGACTSPNPDF